MFHARHQVDFLIRCLTKDKRLPEDDREQRFYERIDRCRSEPAGGATVALVIGSGGAAEALLCDPLWSRLPNLLPVPWDVASVRAVVTPAERPFPDAVLEQMATAFHENYVANSSGRLPDNMKPWPKLPDTFKQANLDQARYAVQILEACGFAVREAESPVLFTDFSEREIEKMADLEHGRWNIDRLRAGWRFGPRDDQRQLHNCLVPWAELPENIKEYDRKAVQKSPEILAKAGFSIWGKRSGRPDLVLREVTTFSQPSQVVRWSACHRA
jgi:hypothetical protein